ncbi:transposase family protein [Glycomyces rhizosphaerae]|uniref:Transposase family protein n=1 Tax=Glycomyces rhizosphaerae TaxID=2054422 RepID=A0ABV7Q790_9ACTN
MLFYPAALPLSTLTLNRVAALQAIADANGNLLWVSGAIRGSIHDTAAARIWQIPRLLAEQGLFSLGDKGYEGLGHEVATPIKGRDKPEWQDAHNRLHARLRGPGERMFAQLKTWSILDQVRCDPHQVIQIAKAVQVLNNYEHHSA